MRKKVKAGAGGLRCILLLSLTSSLSMLLGGCGRGLGDIIDDPRITGEPLFHWKGTVRYADLVPDDDASGTSASPSGGPLGMKFDHFTVVVHYYRVSGEEPAIERAYSGAVASIEKPEGSNHFIGSFDVEFRYNDMASYSIEILHSGDNRRLNFRDKGGIKKGNQTEAADFVVQPVLVGTGFKWTGSVKQQAASGDAVALDDADVTVSAFATGKKDASAANDHNPPDTGAGQLPPDLDPDTYDPENCVMQWTEETNSSGHYDIDFDWSEGFAYTISVTLPGADTVASERQKGLIGNSDQIDDFVISSNLSFAWSGTVKERFLNTAGTAVLDEPLEGTALVKVSVNTGEGEPEVLSCITGSEGAYAIEVPWNKDWTYTLSAQRIGDASADPLEIERGKVPEPVPDSIQTQDFVLDPAIYAWSGKVEAGTSDGSKTRQAGALLELEIKSGTNDVATVETSTNEAGEYELSYPHNESWSYRLDISLSGHSAASLTKNYEAEFMRGDRAEQDFLITGLSQTFIWRGEVSEQYQSPLSGGLIMHNLNGAEVALHIDRRNDELSPLDMTMLSDQGQYEFEVPWDADWLYTISAGRTEQSQPPATEIARGQIGYPGANALIDNFTLPFARYTWEGEVKQVNPGPGNPAAALEGASIRLEIRDAADTLLQTSVATTDAAGAYSLSVPVNGTWKYLLSVFEPGQAVQSEDRQLAGTDALQGARPHEDFLLYDAAIYTWSGFIEDGDGDPLPGADVTLSGFTAGNGGSSAALRQLQSGGTDANGFYNLSFKWYEDLEYTVSYRLSGSSVVEGSTPLAEIVAPGSDQLTNFVYQPAPSFSWSGTVKDASMMLAPDAEVMIIAIDPGNGNALKLVQRGSTNAQGEYSINFKWFGSFEYSIGYRLAGEPQFQTFTLPTTILAGNRVTNFPLGP